MSASEQIVSRPLEERVARAMCAADGKDPDALTRMQIMWRQEQVEGWRVYEDRARLFIAAFEVMSEQGQRQEVRRAART